MQPAVVELVQRKIRTIRTAAHDARLQAEIASATTDLADALHRQECGCGGDCPDDYTRIVAAGLVREGWRRGAPRLADLLDEIACAWEQTVRSPHSTAEDLRWAGVCALAFRIAEEARR